MQQKTPQILEERLVVGLQPIRSFVLAQVLYNFMDNGIQDTIKLSREIAVSDLAKKLHLHEQRLRGFLRYLANEGYVKLTESDIVSLTDSGSEIENFRPWYKLLVGGYAQTFQQLPIVLQVDGPYATRDSTSVGIGSCGISQHDALPMTRRLLDKISGRWRTVVDMGCGDGSYLIDLCLSIPNIRGIGVDPNQVSVDAAILAARQHGIADRVNIQVGTTHTLPDLSNEPGPLCFITAFVLQEVLEQSGRDAVLQLLNSVFDRYPDAFWIVIEVDNRAKDAAIMAEGLGLAYYNPYYLIHHLTEQRLESVEFWEDLYQDAHLHVVSIEYPDSSYDSLGLKVGFLLSRN